MYHITVVGLMLAYGVNKHLLKSVPHCQTVGLIFVILLVHNSVSLLFINILKNMLNKQACMQHEKF